MDNPEIPPPAPWERLSSRTLVAHPWLTLREDRVRLPSGLILDAYHVVEVPSWACTLALTDDGHAVLVEQYRHGIGQSSLELPAGALDPGEAPLEGARRELLEETGYAAERWTPLGHTAPEPGRKTAWAHLFVAEGARRVAAPTLDATEDLALRLVPAHTLPDLAAQGGIVHAVHALVILLAAGRGMLRG